MSALYPIGGEFTIDGVSSDQWHCFYTAFHIGLLPSVRLNAPDIPGRAGKKNAGIEWSSRAVSLDLTFAQRSTLMDDMRGLAAALDPTNALPGTHKIVFKDDDPGKYLNVVPNGDMPVSPSPGTADVTLALEALDPYWYATQSQNIGPTSVNSGGSMQLPNAGSAYVNPVVYVTRRAGVLTGVHLTINGITSVYNGSIVAGDLVAFDFGEMTVMKNGASDIANWSGDFGQIPPGGGPLTYSDTNAVGANLQVQYTERWT